MRLAASALVISVLVAGPAAAAVVDAQPGGFQVKTTVSVAAPPEKVWAELVHPGRWWDPQHTWSGDAGNMTLEARAGGCFCEKMPDGGGVQHLVIVNAQPGKTLIGRGGLGPLQDLGGEGAMSWTLKPVAGGTELTQSFTFGGYMPGGLAGLAPVVDQVLGTQLNRLKVYVETGRPTP